MADVFKLYWSDKYLGEIQNPRLLDFPWLVGDFTAGKIDEQLAEVLEWFANVAEGKIDDDELINPPFSQELTDNWYIETPDGLREAISIPIIDKGAGTISWR